MEYKVIKLNSQDLEDLLNDAAKDGWHLITIYEDRFIFSRFNVLDLSYEPKIQLL